MLTPTDMAGEEYCETTHCDFSELTVGTDLDWDELYISCGLIAYTNSTTSYISVFDSGNITTHGNKKERDADLGAPNHNCKPRGPGRGKGGFPSAAFPNCDPLGNLLILQNPDIADRPNDDPNGGCIYIDPIVLFRPYFQFTIHDFGLLDIEEGASIRVRILKKKHFVCFILLF
jgi:hypothetical protein